MDKKHRRWKKNVKRNLKIIAKKIPLAFESGREKRNWIKQCLREHPAVKGQKGDRACSKDSCDGNAIEGYPE
jgi:hypothetical protein